MKRRNPDGRSLRPDEAEVWNRVARTVRRLEPSAKTAKPAPPLFEPFDDPQPLKASAAPRAMSAPAKLGATASPESVRMRPAVDRSGEKKIRRGHVEVESRIDLHGLTQAKARQVLLRFLLRRHHDGERTVLVITGKGVAPHAVQARRYESWDPDARALPGVLRRSFTEWMTQPDFTELASGYAPAHRRHGGAGAFYVMLRR
ncbi:MAG: Smr/MutS family protein [Pseudomonadota bacterium]